MKAGIKTSLLILAGLLISQAAFGATEKEREALAKRVSSTKLQNLANTSIVVKGFGGSSWTIKSHGTTTFQRGLQDNLVIEVGVPPLAVLHFDMTHFKPHFAEIITAKYFSGTLEIYGRLRRDSAKRDEPKKETWHLNQLRSYCGAMNCQINQEITEPYFCTISNIRPVQTKQGVREDFAEALDTATRITHPTKFTNNTNGIIQVKGALGVFTTVKQGADKSESFQAGLQDNLQIKVRADSEPGKVNWKILEFNLKQIKDQFSWIKSATLVEHPNFVQRTVPELVSSYTLTLHGIPKRDVPSDKGLSRKTMLKDSCVGCDVRTVQDGTVFVLGIKPK